MPPVFRGGVGPRRCFARDPAKRTAMPAEAPGRDRLSALPDDLLQHVLGFLDTRLAVGPLSLLSRRWRHLWASMPRLNLDASVPERFGSVLFLLRDDAKLHTFTLRCSRTNNQAFVYQHWWLRHAVSKGIRVLHIAADGAYRFDLPDCVFNCATLEEIVLSLTIPEEIAPKSVCLPRLKKLRLVNVRLPDSSVVESLKSGLEELDLHRCSLYQFRISSHTVKTLSVTACAYEEIHVSAPNVASLRLTVAGRVKLDGMPSLLTAWVNISGHGANHLAPNEHDFLGALCSTQHLELFNFDSLLQDMMQNPATEDPKFGKLKSLYLGELVVADFYRPFAYFLNHAPNLASLTLDTSKVFEENVWNRKVSCQVSTLKEPYDKMNLAPESTGLEMLRLRISKGRDAAEYSKMRKLLKEKTKPKEMEVIWF
ncbi:F-box/LRR-repeat protein At4g14103 isoform X1 [Brachypodium distachyon]|uniref:F-box domain-containing protein n=1 Tax=Brachypodium distachyon TaxID=15368 RepID=A0A0Q3HKG3_BRADI|nr:F-box/LRR-repeat protein At4g14103 isoform X1 [Brachypodium distachyon]KQJ93826.1 hypothetical protein BRADI_3g06922v3 [Brachypodium distachyon]KQJ93828.1 hypothetical protein BRADI_3g06922v3 [Brachypodium distachyon]|eukprot:XP_003571065.1 F-box/LRR-repeat protein At4g14103 isoform X1 [Brachypodium distachyon]